ncbi:MAG: hypothetical protein ABI333_13015 [bacterium]
MSIRKKVFTLFLSLALLGVFSTAACAPSPEDVCAHMKKLATKEVGAKLADKANEGCIKRWKRAKEMKGYFKYRKTARCVVAKSKLKDITDCK